jgi:DNA-binding PadR family transcriptional regulator
VSGEALAVSQGSLYPALHRLERRGWITAEWGVSDNNRQAKYYSLAKAGRTRLQAGSSSWHRFVEVAGRALRATAPVPTS